MVHFRNSNGFQDMTENMEISIFGKLHFCNFFSSKKSLQRFCYIAWELSILGENISSDGQNFCSKGSKWVIVHLCSSNSVWDMTEVMDILTFVKMYFLTFFIKNVKVIDDRKIRISTKITLSCQKKSKMYLSTNLSHYISHFSQKME